MFQNDSVLSTLFFLGCRTYENREVLYFVVPTYLHYARNLISRNGNIVAGSRQDLITFKRHNVHKIPLYTPAVLGPVFSVFVYAPLQ
jgi:hypothetical protein